MKYNRDREILIYYFKCMGIVLGLVGIMVVLVIIMFR